MSDFIACILWVALLDCSFNTRLCFWFVLNKQSGGPRFYEILCKKIKTDPWNLWNHMRSARGASDMTPSGRGSAQNYCLLIGTYLPTPPSGRLDIKNRWDVSSDFLPFSDPDSFSIGGFSHFNHVFCKFKGFLIKRHSSIWKSRIWCFHILFICNSPECVYPSAGVSETARLKWVRLNVVVNVFASIKQTSSHWQFVSGICVAAPDRTLTASVITLVVAEEPSCCDQEHRSLRQGISSQCCIKLDDIRSHFHPLSRGKLKKKTHHLIVPWKGFFTHTGSIWTIRPCLRIWSENTKCPITRTNPPCSFVTARLGMQRLLYDVRSF